MQRGKQYMRAIQLYFGNSTAYPPNVDALVKTNEIRFLRKRYTDPMTGKDDWKPIKFGQNKTPLAMGFFGQPLVGGRRWRERGRAASPARRRSAAACGSFMGGSAGSSSLRSGKFAVQGAQALGGIEFHGFGSSLGSSRVGGNGRRHGDRTGAGQLEPAGADSSATGRDRARRRPLAAEGSSAFRREATSSRFSSTRRRTTTTSGSSSTVRWLDQTMTQGAIAGRTGRRGSLDGTGTQTGRAGLSGGSPTSA